MLDAFLYSLLDLDDGANRASPHAGTLSTKERARKGIQQIFSAKKN
jgi:hypothetical protein